MKRSTKSSPCSPSLSCYLEPHFLPNAAVVVVGAAGVEAGQAVAVPEAALSPASTRPRPGSANQGANRSANQTANQGANRTANANQSANRNTNVNNNQNVNRNTNVNNNTNVNVNRNVNVNAPGQLPWWRLLRWRLLL